MLVFRCDAGLDYGLVFGPSPITFTSLTRDLTHEAGHGEASLPCPQPQGVNLLSREGNSLRDHWMAEGTEEFIRNFVS